MSELPLIQVQPARTRPVLDPSARAQLERRAKLLAWGGNAWHLVEFAIAVGAGIAAGSVALVAFGVDSLIELLAGGVVIWLFSGGRGSSAVAERRAQRLIALSFYLLAGYVVIESLRAFWAPTRRPAGSASGWRRSPPRRCRSWHAQSRMSAAAWGRGRPNRRVRRT